MSHVELKKKHKERREEKEREGMPPVRVRTDGVIEPEASHRPMRREEWERLTLEEKVEIMAQRLKLVE